MKNTSSVVLAFMCMLVLAGCGQKKDASTLTLELPNWKELERKHSAQVSAQAIQSVVSRVMINVSSSDMSSPIVYIWDINQQARLADGSFASPPATVTLDVKRGSARMFQALAIVESIDTVNESNEGPMTFYYGDVTKSISGDEASDAVSLMLASQGTSLSGSSSISGRYVNSDGSYSTGKINMFFAPPGKPEMIVDQNQTMFSGYFRIFLPSNVLFSYRLASGQALFERINTTAIPFRSSTAVTRIEIPAAFRENSSSGRSSILARTKFAGFFGNVSNRPICYPDAPGFIPGLYDAISGGSPVSWNPLSVSSSDARVVVGGTGSAAGACSAGEFGVDHFSIELGNIANGDSPIGVRGPFRELTPGSNQYVSLVTSGTAPRVTWKYMRPTLGHSVAGVGIFHYTIPVNGSNPIRDRDSLACSSLPSMGFIEAARVPFDSVASPVESYDIVSVKTVNFNSGQFLAVVCPYSTAGTYYDFGLIQQNSNGQAPATKITAKVLLADALSTAAVRNKYAREVCTPIQIRTVDANGGAAYRSTSNGVTPQLTLSITAGALASFYPDSMCGTAYVGGTVQIPMWGSEQVIYLRSQSGANDIDITVSDSTGSGTALPSEMAYLAAIPKATPSSLRSVTSTTSIYAHQCYPINFVRGLLDGTDFVPQASGSANPTFADNIAATPGLSFHSGFDSNCTEYSPSGAYFMGSDVSNVPLYFKYSGALSSISIQPNGTSASYAVSPLNLSVIQPGTPSKALIHVSSSIPAESCTPLRIQVVDVQNRASALAPSQSMQVDLTGTQGFFSDPMCSSAIGLSANVTVGPGQTFSNVVYAQWASPIVSSISGVHTAGLNLPIQSTTVTVGPAQASFITARVAGVSYTFLGGYLGDGAQGILGGQFGNAGEFTVQFEARSILGNLVAGFNDTNAGPGGVNLSSSAGSVSCQPITWTLAGVGAGTGVAQCILPPALMFDFVQFYTGGGKYSSHTTPAQFFASRSAETYTSALYTRLGAYTTGTCYPLMFHRRHSEYAALAANPITRMLGAPPIGVSAYYSDSNCVTTITSVTIPAKNSAVVYFMKMDGLVPGNPQLDGAGWYDPVALAVPTLINSNPSVASQLKLTMARDSKLGACEPLMVVNSDAAGVPIVPAVAFTATLNATGSSFYAAGDCSGAPITTINFGTTVSTKLVYLKMGMLGVVTSTVADGAKMGSVSVTVTGLP